MVYSDHLGDYPESINPFTKRSPSRCGDEAKTSALHIRYLRDDYHRPRLIASNLSSCISDDLTPFAYPFYSPNSPWHPQQPPNQSPSPCPSPSSNSPPRRPGPKQPRSKCRCRPCQSSRRKCKSANTSRADWPLRSASLENMDMTRAWSRSHTETRMNQSLTFSYRRGRTHHPPRPRGSHNLLGEPVRQGILADESIRLDPGRPPRQSHRRRAEPHAQRRGVYDSFCHPRRAS